MQNHVEPVIEPEPAVYRQDDELPPVVTQRGWRYHHVGIPTTLLRGDEEYLAAYKLYRAGFSRSPYGIEWMRFEAGCPLPALIQTVAHVAFEVDDLDVALIGQEIIWPPGAPSEGVRSAMIAHNGAPVELIWFARAVRATAQPPAA